MASKHKYWAWDSADIYPCEKAEASFVDIDAHEYEVKALRERLADADKVIEVAKDLHYASGKLDRARLLKSLYVLVDKYEGVK